MKPSINPLTQTQLTKQKAQQVQQAAFKIDIKEITNQICAFQIAEDTIQSIITNGLAQLFELKIQKNIPIFAQSLMIQSGELVLDQVLKNCDCQVALFHEDMEPIRSTIERIQTYSIPTTILQKEVDSFDGGQLLNDSQISQKTLTNRSMYRYKTLISKKNSQGDEVTKVNNECKPIPLQSNDDQLQEDDFYRAIHEQKVNKLEKAVSQEKQFEQEKLQKMIKLRQMQSKVNKNGFTYDYDGGYIHIDKTKRLPQMQYEIQAKIIDEENVIQSQQIQNTLDTSYKQNISNPSIKRKPNPIKREVQQESFVEPVQQSQTQSITKVQYTNEFNQLKMKDILVNQIRNPALKLSRQQYQEMTQLTNRISGRPFLKEEQTHTTFDTESHKPEKQRSSQISQNYGNELKKENDQSQKMDLIRQNNHNSARIKSQINSSQGEIKLHSEFNVQEILNFNDNEDLTKNLPTQPMKLRVKSKSQYILGNNKISVRQNKVQEKSYFLQKEKTDTIIKGEEPQLPPLQDYRSKFQKKSIPSFQKDPRDRDIITHQKLNSSMQRQTRSQTTGNNISNTYR